MCLQCFICLQLCAFLVFAAICVATIMAGPHIGHGGSFGGRGRYGGGYGGGYGSSRGHRGGYDGGYRSFGANRGGNYYGW